MWLTWLVGKLFLKLFLKKCLDQGLYWSSQNRAESHSQYLIGIFKTLFTIWQQYFPAWKITPSSSHLLLYAWYIIFIQFGHSQKNPILGHAYWQQKIHSIVSTIHFQHFWIPNKIIWFFFSMPPKWRRNRMQVKSKKAWVQSFNTASQSR